MQQFINYLQNVPSSSWHQLWVVLISSGVVAIVLQALKHFLSIGGRKKLVTVLLAALSFVATISDWLIQNISQNPLLLGRQTATVLGTAVVIHRFLVSPLYHKVALGLQGLLKDAQVERDRRNALANAETDVVTPKEFTL